MSREHCCASAVGVDFTLLLAPWNHILTASDWCKGFVCYRHVVHALPQVIQVDAADGAVDKDAAEPHSSGDTCEKQQLVLP